MNVHRVSIYLRAGMTAHDHACIGPQHMNSDPFCTEKKDTTQLSFRSVTEIQQMHRLVLPHCVRHA